MLVTLQAVRVYGSSNYFGAEPRQAPDGNPLLFSDMPARGERTSISLGPAPNAILQANRLRRAVGVAMLSALVGGTNGLYGDALIEAKLAELGEDSLGRDFNWYVTLIIEREIEVDDSKRTQIRLIWLEHTIAVELKDSFLAYVQPHFDVLTTHLSASLGFSFFENLVMSDRVFFLSEGCPAFGFPESSTTMVLGVGQTAPPDLTALKARLRPALSLSTNSWLRTAQHWHLVALSEHDPIKAFLWSFLALEILTHKLRSRFYRRVVQNLRLQTNGGGDVLTVEEAIGEIVWRQDRLPLEAEFAIAAMALFPGDANADLAQFDVAKKARDNLAHGTATDLAALPLRSTRQLLEKYLAATIRL